MEPCHMKMMLKMGATRPEMCPKGTRKTCPTMKEEVMQELAALQSLQWPGEHKQIYGHMNPFIEKNLRVLVQRPVMACPSTMQPCNSL